MENWYLKVNFSFSKIKVYLIGGISAAIQANVDLYRKNEDLKEKYV